MNKTEFVRKWEYMFRLVEDTYLISGNAMEDLPVLMLRDALLVIKGKKDVKNQSTPDEAYLDRNLCVQTMAKMALKLGYTTGIKDDLEWPILYIDLPTGQVSWHIPKNEILADFQEYKGKWDGHCVEEKRNRIIKFLEVSD
ncbi:MAG: hypothetical protein M1431_04170 [Candidatus Thermoplasmatota archaeon]|nr:hypothetical protein [Candidatus Thermoplasmatota archaeon]